MDSRTNQPRTDEDYKHGTNSKAYDRHYQIDTRRNHYFQTKTKPFIFIPSKPISNLAQPSNPSMAHHVTTTTATKNEKKKKTCIGKNSTDTKTLIHPYHRNVSNPPSQKSEPSLHLPSSTFLHRFRICIAKSRKAKKKNQQSSPFASFKSRADLAFFPTPSRVRQFPTTAVESGDLRSQ